jgi:hypothetical protein
LEGSSYPIEILDQKKVKGLITSKEMAEKEGEAPMALTCNFGLGSGFHLVSHYYLQRRELRTARHEMPSTYFAAKGLPLEEAMEDLPRGYAAYASNLASFIAWVSTSPKEGGCSIKIMQSPCSPSWRKGWGLTAPPFRFQAFTAPLGRRNLPHR